MNMKSYRSYEYILFRRKISDISTNIVPFFLQIKYNIENIYYSLILRKIMFSDKRFVQTFQMFQKNTSNVFCTS